MKWLPPQYCFGRFPEHCWWDIRRIMYFQEGCPLFFKNVSNSESLSRDALKRHLVGGCLKCLVFKLKETGTWSPIMIRLILVLDISDIIDLLVISQCERLIGEGVRNMSILLLIRFSVAYYHQDQNHSYYLSVSVKWQFLELPEMLDLYRAVMMTVLK